jgi:hypothetical protein
MSEIFVDPADLHSNQSDPVTELLNKMNQIRKEEHICPRCGSKRWVSASFNGGITKFAQCVPCGEVGDYLNAS